MDQKKVKELKVGLYRALLFKETSEITDNEIDIMYYLSEDEEIQEILGAVNAEAEAQNK
jgi:hypothetical protein